IGPPSGVRLDLALIQRQPGLSRRRARAAIEKGQVSVEGQIVREAGQLVPASAEVAWDANRPTERRARLSLPLLYADESVLVVDKPAGLLAVPSSPEATEED